MSNRSAEAHIRVPLNAETEHLGLGVRAETERGRPALGVDHRPEFVVRQGGVGGSLRPVGSDRPVGTHERCAQRCQMRQKVGDRTAGHGKTGVRNVAVGKRISRVEDIQADRHFHVDDLPMLARLH